MLQQKSINNSLKIRCKVTQSRSRHGRQRGIQARSSPTPPPFR